MTDINRYGREAKEQRKEHIDKHSEETMDELRLRLLTLRPIEELLDKYFDDPDPIDGEQDWRAPPVWGE